MTIDWSHPLAAGLVCAYLPGVHGSAMVAPDLVTAGAANRNAVATGTPTIAVSPAGAGVLTQKGATNYLGPAAAAVSLPAGGQTIAWGGWINSVSTDATAPYIEQLFGAETGGGPYIRLGSGTLANNGKVQYYAGSGPASTSADLSSLIPGRFDIVGSCSNNFRDCTINGVNVDHSVAWSTAETFWPVFGSVPGSRGADAVHLYGYAWNRALTRTEQIWLYAEPYAFLTPPAPRISYFSLPSVTLPTITAAATLPRLTAAATLAPSDPITAAATLPGLTASATVAPSDPITAAATLPGLTGSGTLAPSTPLTAAATLPALTGAAVLAPSDPMTGAATLPALTAAATLAPAAPFTGAATLPALTAAATLGRIPAPRGVVTLEDTAARGTITVAGTTSRGRITIHDAAARGTITVE